MGNKVKILVVDDSHTMRGLHVASLNNMGYKNVDEAEDGTHAIEMIRKNSYSLILMDWVMPEMNGLECLKNIKGDDSISDVPVIMVTAESENHRVLEAIQAGAASYIRKPVDDDDLKEKVTAALEGR